MSSKLRNRGSDETDEAETLVNKEDQYQSWLQLNQINRSHVFNMPRFKDIRAWGLLIVTSSQDCCTLSFL
ncbi:hypothetical protein RB195_010556 [Necator americanus]|uniref:Uncharacterized protein n=1 Tax=Necator americanus TaxID=51031 RepID=A0ABR1CZK9_NECAM